MIKLATELAFATDGRIYTSTEGVELEKRMPREQFMGYAMTRDEMRRMGMRGLLLFALVMKIAIGSDGRVYVDCGTLEARIYEEREVFQGCAMTEEEAASAVKEIHRLAFNVTLAVDAAMTARRGTTKRRWG